MREFQIVSSRHGLVSMVYIMSLLIYLFVFTVVFGLKADTRTKDITWRGR